MAQCAGFDGGESAVEFVTSTEPHPSNAMLIGSSYGTAWRLLSSALGKRRASFMAAPLPGWMKRITLVVLVVAFAAAAFAAPAGAAPTDILTKPPAVFVGECSVDGHATFSPSLGQIPVLSSWHYLAYGACTGNINGQNVVNTPVTYEITAEGPVSCSFGYTLAAPNTLTFNDSTNVKGDRTITGTFNLVQTAGANNAVITGSTAGVATGETTFFQNGIVNVVQKCTAGTVDAFDATVTFAGALTG